LSRARTSSIVPHAGHPPMRAPQRRSVRSIAQRTSERWTWIRVGYASANALQLVARHDPRARRPAAEHGARRWLRFAAAPDVPRRAAAMSCRTSAAPSARAMLMVTVEWPLAFLRAGEAITDFSILRRGPAPAGRKPLPRTAVLPGRAGERRRTRVRPITTSPPRGGHARRWGSVVGCSSGARDTAPHPVRPRRTDGCSTRARCAPARGATASNTPLRKWSQLVIRLQTPSVDCLNSPRPLER
jgi:hypothetical protein